MFAEHVSLSRETQAILVFGFIREIQQTLPQNHNFYIIPTPLKKQCLEYYLVKEYFDLTCNGVKISNDKSTIVRTDKGSSGSGTNYGFASISSTQPLIHRWRIKLINGGGSSAMLVIGISSIQTPKDNIFSCFYRSSSSVGTHYCYGYNCYSGSKFRQNRSNPYGIYCLNGATIDMEYNVKCKCLRYHINGRDQGNAFDDIASGDDISYRLTVHLGKVENCVEIESFQSIEPK